PLRAVQIEPAIAAGRAALSPTVGEHWQGRGRHETSMPQRIDARRYVRHSGITSTDIYGRPGMTSTSDAATREQVRARYAAAATAVTEGSGGGTAAACCGPGDAGGCCGDAAIEVDESFGSALYSAAEQDELPAEAVAASLGCGNPLAVAELRAGE